MGANEAYQQKLEAQLRIWDAEIDVWKAKADKASAEAKLQYYQQLDGVYARREVVREKLLQLKLAGGEAWEGLKAGLEAAWEEFKIAYEKAAAKFK